MRHIIIAAVLLLAGAGGAPLAAEVVSQGPAAFDVSNRVRIAADPDAVYRALIMPNRWWSSDHSWSGDAKNMYLSAQAGGCFCELLPAVKGSVEHAHVILARPGKELRMVGSLGPLQAQAVTGVLHFALTAQDGGTEVVMRYTVSGAFEGDVAQLAPAVDAVLAQQLSGLKSFAESPAS